MVKRFILHLNDENCMTVEKTTKVRLNALIYAQAGLIVTFIVSAIVFYGSQLEINKSNSDFKVKQEKFNNKIQQQVFNVSLDAGIYATKESLTRGLSEEKASRIKYDDELKVLIKENQREIIDLLKK